MIGPPRGANSRLSRQNPWPGLDAYTEDVRDFFRGREIEIEIEELLQLIRRETLTVLYGQSGLGKTSLLQAGLFPDLRKADFLPLFIRLDHHESAPGLVSQVRAALNASIQERRLDAPRFAEDETLWEYFQRKDADFWNERNRLVTPVLVFDQFEEIFTLGRANEARRTRGQEFLAELGCLIERRPPQVVQHKLDAGELEPGRFFFDRDFCKVVLSLREDYLADLDSLRTLIRGSMSNRMRLQRLRGAQALKVVQEPGAELLEMGVAEDRDGEPK
jgi:hypothetical protein